MARYKITAQMPLVMADSRDWWLDKFKEAGHQVEVGQSVDEGKSVFTFHVEATSESGAKLEAAKLLTVAESVDATPE